MLKITHVLWAAALLAACSRDKDISRDQGARCDSVSDCTTRCLPAPAWPGGMCTRDCLKDTDCPVSSVCVTTGEGPVCLFSCLDDRDCDFLNGLGASGWRCLSTAGKLACAAGVLTDAGPVDAAGSD